MMSMYELVSLPEYGDHMTMQDWISCVECGGFIDYDGYGCYATKTKMLSNGKLYHIKPSDLKAGKINRKWSHVVWFNK